MLGCSSNLILRLLTTFVVVYSSTLLAISKCDVPLGEIVALEADGRTQVYRTNSHNPYRMVIEQLERARYLIPAFNGPLGDRVFKRTAEPERVLHMEIPFSNDQGKPESVHAYHSLHSSERGPGKGGTRVGTDVTIFETVGLSGWMTWKGELAQILFGGAKGGIQLEKGRKYSQRELNQIYRGYIRKAFEIVKDPFGPDVAIAAPDAGSNARVMRIMLDEIIRIRLERGQIHDKALEKVLLESGILAKAEESTKLNPGDTVTLDKYKELVGDLANPKYDAKELASVTGKHPDDWGDKARNEATGRVVYYSIRETFKHMAKDYVQDPAAPLKGLKFAIFGAGNVGGETGLGIMREGKGTVNRVVEKIGEDKYLIIDDPKGIDIEAFVSYMVAWNGSNRAEPFSFHYEGLSIREVNRAIAIEEFITSDVNGLIPADRGEQFTAETLMGTLTGDTWAVKRMKAEFVIEGGNGPTTTEGDALFRSHGKTVIPDFLANQGGAVGSAYEYRQNIDGQRWDKARVLSALNDHLMRSFAAAHGIYVTGKVEDMRQAAYVVAVGEEAKRVEQRIIAEDEAARSQSQPTGSAAASGR